MAKKQMSFAEKATRHKSKKDWKTVQYVKSERSEKTGSWRFNENFIQLASNENLDQALTRMEQEVKALAEEMASIEESTVKVEEKVEVKTEESTVTEETKTKNKINPSDQAKDSKPKQPAQKA